MCLAEVIATTLYKAHPLSPKTNREACFEYAKGLPGVIFTILDIQRCFVFPDENPTVISSSVAARLGYCNFVAIFFKFTHF